MTTKILSSSIVILVVLHLTLHRAAAFLATNPGLGGSKMPLAATSDRNGFEFDRSFETFVESDNTFSRRGAMKHASSIVIGLSAVATSQPAYAADVHEIRMGTEENPEELVFEPDSITIRSGDTVRWIKNPGLTQHNVVFAQEDVPAGVNAEKLSMGVKERLKKGSFERQFSEKGEYTYACTPHCTVMSGRITVV